MKYKIFTCCLLCSIAISTSAQQPVYPKPSEDLARYNRKEMPPMPIYQNANDIQRFNQPPKNYLQSTFDTISRRFKINTAASLYESYVSPVTNIQDAAKPFGVTSDCFHITKDINKATENSNPQNYRPYSPYTFAVKNSISYFSANDGIHGDELWRSDGNAAGTYMLKDINSGSEASYPNEITNVNGLMFFNAKTADTGIEPWVSDGTAAGTHLLKDLQSGPNNSWPTQFVQAGSSVFFVTSLDNYNAQLWKTNGTEAGTTKVKDLTQAGIGYQILELTAVNNIVYFIAYTWDSYFQLFRSDGTEAGTYKVKQIGSVTYDNAAPMHLTAYNNQLYFSVDDSGGRRLWVSDGTESGTHYAPGFNDVFIHQELQSIFSNEPFAIMNNVLFISGFTASAGSGLYKYDASNANGLVLVKDLTPNADQTQVETPEMEVIGNVMYFKVLAFSGDLPHYELWKTNGASNNTMPVKEFLNGDGLYGFFNSNGALVFSKSDNINGTELWTSDGTEAGTKMVRDIVAGSFGSFPENFTFCNGKLLFRAADNFSGAELWSSNLTNGGTVLVKDINSATTQSSNAGFWYKGIAPSSNGVVFWAVEPGHGGELYKSNGTAYGTYLLNDIVPGPQWSYPNSFIYKNGFNYFIGDNVVGTTIYRTDGKPGGLKKLVFDINRDVYYVTNFNITDNGMAFYILGNRNTYAYELWRSDGTQAGTFILCANLPYDSYIVTIANTVYFAAGDLSSGSGIELWKSDGTVTGTKMVKDIYPGNFSSFPYSLFVYKKDLYFGAYDGIGLLNNYQLWKTDGTENGTIKIKNITPARYDYIYSPDVQVFCISNNTLFFSATELQVYGAELWKTNGTSNGTEIVKDINIQGYSSPYWLTDVNGTLYFLADDGINGQELWKSKGTENSTNLVKDITPSGYWVPLNNLCAVGNTLYFLYGSDPKLWSSDGTSNNTKAVTDPGLNGLTDFGKLVSSGNKLFFGAQTALYGKELFVRDCGHDHDHDHDRPVLSELDFTKPDLPVDAMLYPNPSAGSASLRLTGEWKNVFVTIADISGKVYWKGSFESATQINLPVDKLNAGIYTVTVRSDGRSKSLKLIRK